MPTTSSTTAAPSVLRRALAREEIRTGSSLDDTARLGLPLWETTLSQMLWFALATDPATRSRLRIRVYSQTEEGTNGADWMWAFSSPKSSVVMPLLVQAKRLRDRRYAINQPAGADTQLEVFTRYARRMKIPAAYVFYNPQSAAPRLSQPCHWESRLCPLGGITLADAHEVAAITGTTTPEHIDPTRVYASPLGLTIADVAWPLSCGLCCSVDHTWPSAPFADAIGAALKASGIHGMTTVRDSPIYRDLEDTLGVMRDTPSEPQPPRDPFGREGEAASAAGAFLDRYELSGLVSVELDDLH